MTRMLSRRHATHTRTRFVFFCIGPTAFRFVFVFHASRHDEQGRAENKNDFFQIRFLFEEKHFVADANLRRNSNEKIIAVVSARVLYVYWTAFVSHYASIKYRRFFRAEMLCSSGSNYSYTDLLSTTNYSGRHYFALNEFVLTRARAYLGKIEQVLSRCRAVFFLTSMRERVNERVNVWMRDRERGALSYLASEQAIKQ